MEGQRLWDKGPYFAQSEYFKLGTDSVLLGDFVNIGGRVRGIDLGCGSGILPLLLLWRSDRLHMTGLEIDPAAADMARENMAENGLGGRCEIVTGDIKDCRLLFASGEFELVVSNPPYFAAGSGGVSPDGRKAAARGELLCSLEDICRAAAYLCRTGGVFCLVYAGTDLFPAFAVVGGAAFGADNYIVTLFKCFAAPKAYFICIVHLIYISVSSKILQLYYITYIGYIVNDF